eukprot:COSAG01_NODE_2168_length_8243_cov_2.796442_6_plen_56_part_00
MGIYTGAGENNGIAYENVGESQSLLITNDPVISTRTRMPRILSRCACACLGTATQ